MPMTAAEAREKIKNKEIYDLLNPLDPYMTDAVEALLAKAKDDINTNVCYKVTETKVNTRHFGNDLGESAIVIKILDILGYTVIKKDTSYGSCVVTVSCANL